MSQKIAQSTYTLSRIKNVFFLTLAKSFPLFREFRAKIFRLGGIQIESGLQVRIGKVTFDRIHPEDISIGEGTSIADGCTILTHFLKTDFRINSQKATFHYYRGKVVIGKRVYIGQNSMVVKPVNIGDGAIIGAGSIISKDIPPYTIWAGNPIQFIKERKKI